MFTCICSLVKEKGEEWGFISCVKSFDISFAFSTLHLLFFHVAIESRLILLCIFSFPTFYFSYVDGRVMGTYLPVRKKVISAHCSAT